MNYRKYSSVLSSLNKISITYNYRIEIFKETRQMIWWLKTLIALAKDTGLISSTHRWLMTIQNSSSRRSNALFWPLQASFTRMTHRYTCCHTHEIKIDRRERGGGKKKGKRRKTKKRISIQTVKVEQSKTLLYTGNGRKGQEDPSLTVSGNGKLA